MNKDRMILVVDDKAENIHVVSEILKEQYKVIAAKSGKKALALAQENPPDLILLDVMMPEMDGYETCRKFKSSIELSKIPIIFVTSLTESEDESLGFSAGAVDYIIKPISGPILLARIGTHIALYKQQRAIEEQVIERTAEIEANQRAAIDMLGEAGHYNDTDTGMHIWRMAEYAAALARAAGWDVKRAEILKLAAPMHDVGKIGISDAILKKPAKHTTEETKVMRTHCQIGYDILSPGNTELFKMAAILALRHHEKWDGSGYPDGLVGEDIPEAARIVPIADVFDALMSKRPYKEAWPIDEALAEIRKHSGTHFEPRLVDCFVEIEDEIRGLNEKWAAIESEEKG